MKSGCGLDPFDASMQPYKRLQTSETLTGSHYVASNSLLDCKVRL